MNATEKEVLRRGKEKAVYESGNITYIVKKRYADDGCELGDALYDAVYAKLRFDND